MEDEGKKPSGKKVEVFEPLSEKECAYLMAQAREAVAAKLGLSREKAPEQAPADMPRLKEKRGIFVTLHKDGRLRGCIGNHEGGKPLWRQARDTALDSAFGDPRFPPVTRGEFKDLEFELSVYLSPVTKVDGHEDFVAGKHGIILRNGFRGATFLPHVATEQGWDKETTLRHLCAKAGLPPDAWKSPDTDYYLYATQIIEE